MSLVRLLKAGKSLTDLRNSTSRYQLRTRFLLPKFGATKNPFSAPVPVELIQAAGESTPGTERYQKSPAELSAARLKQTAKLPETVPAEIAGPKPAAVRPVLRQPGIFRFVRWIQFFNPLRWWRKPAAVSRPALARPGRLPIQAELSLDKIKVMRNDLNDADVEIMPAKTPMKVKPDPAPPPGRGAVAMTTALIETQPG